MEISPLPRVLLRQVKDLEGACIDDEATVPSNTYGAPFRLFRLILDHSLTPNSRWKTSNLLKIPLQNVDLKVAMTMYGDNDDHIAHFLHPNLLILHSIVRENKIHIFSCPPGVPLSWYLERNPTARQTQQDQLCDLNVLRGPGSKRTFEETARLVGYQLFSALKYLHKNSTAHMDVEAGNVQFAGGHVTLTGTEKSQKVIESSVQDPRSCSPASFKVFQRHDIMGVLVIMLDMLLNDLKFFPHNILEASRTRWRTQQFTGESNEFTSAILNFTNKLPEIIGKLRATEQDIYREWANFLESAVFPLYSDSVIPVRPNVFIDTNQVLMHPFFQWSRDYLKPYYAHYTNVINEELGCAPVVPVAPDQLHDAHQHWTHPELQGQHTSMLSELHLNQQDPNQLNLALQLARRSATSNLSRYNGITSANPCAKGNAAFAIAMEYEKIAEILQLLSVLSGQSNASRIRVQIGKELIRAEDYAGTAETWFRSKRATMWGADLTGVYKSKVLKETCAIKLKNFLSSTQRLVQRTKYTVRQARGRV